MATSDRLSGYPVLFARASLKLRFCTPLAEGRNLLPRAFCAGLIEASVPFVAREARRWLPRAFCAGLIEATKLTGPCRRCRRVTPCFLRGPH